MRNFSGELMTDHITLRIGQPSPLMSLTGQKVSSTYEVEHETQRALLISVVRMVEGMEVDRTGFWFPKSMISVDGRVPRGSSASEVSGAKVIKIPSWLWEKKEAVKPMGASR